MADVIGTPSKLTGSPINIAELRESARAELEELLAEHGGSRTCLCVDPALLPVLRLVVTGGSR